MCHGINNTLLFKVYDALRSFETSGMTRLNATQRHISVHTNLEI